MLIVNADDFGKNRETTDRILLCFKSDRITSATAMMFMADSERSAETAVESGLDVGLHLNLSDRFTGNHHGTKLDECHERVSKFLNKTRFSVLLYNPLLRRDFDYTFKSQWNRFVELYGKAPTHVDGHRHKHLCANALLGALIPAGTKVRRNFIFDSNEKGVFNRCYRMLVDWYLRRKYVCADYFFSIRPFENRERIRRIGNLSRKSDVELMVHPDLDAELGFLMGHEYVQLLDGISKGSYSMLHSKGTHAGQE